MGSKGARSARRRITGRRGRRRKSAGPLRYLLAAGLNLVPGFGIGYLLVGRRKPFLASILGWKVAGGIIVYGIVGGRTCSGGLECLGWVAPIALGFLLGVAGVNLPGAVHLFVVFVRRSAFRGN
jgi:hypothetical protein